MSDDPKEIEDQVYKTVTLSTLTRDEILELLSRVRTRVLTIPTGTVRATYLSTEDVERLLFSRHEADKG